MRAGGGKSKGAAFERDVCKQLSLWLSEGKRDDLLWRSAMSGGRATIGRRTGKERLAQAGDISAIDPLGDKLTSLFAVECKCVASLGIESFCLRRVGSLGAYWTQTCLAAPLGREPMLIAKQNRSETLIFLGGQSHKMLKYRLMPRTLFEIGYLKCWRLDAFLAGFKL